MRDSASSPDDLVAGKGGVRKVPLAVWVLLAAWLAVDAWILVKAEAPWVTAVELAQNEADGVRPHWTTQAAPGIWWAAAINAVLALGLLVGARWWAVGLEPRSGFLGGEDGGARGSGSRPLRHGHPWFWILLTLIVLVSGAVRLPLASKSLWWDELWAVKQASHGQWREDRRNPGELRFVETTWDRAAWYFLKPTNHPTASLAQKASLDTWRLLTGAERHEFSDLAARVPSLVASAVAVGAVGVLLHVWGMPVAGLMAAGLLALHPWAIRYGVDSRAYAFVIPLVPLALLWLTQLHRQPWRWRWWWLLAGNQFLLLWTFPNAIPMAMALFLAAAAILCHRLRPSGTHVRAWMRLVAVHVVAAMAFFHAFLPNLMQVIQWGPDPQPMLGLPVLIDTLTCFAVGMPYRAIETGSPVVGWLSLREGFWWPGVWLGFQLVAILLGMLALWHRSRVGLLAVLSIFGFAALYVIVSWWRGIYFYPRYLICLLPLLIILVAVGWTQGAAWFARRVRAPVAPAAAATAAFACCWFVALVWPQLQVLWQRPISPMRDTVRFIRAQAGGEDAVIIAYGLGGRVLDVYAPGTILAHDRNTITEGLTIATERDRPAWLVRGYDAFDRQHMPGGFELIDDPQWFEFVEDFDGIEPSFQYRVYRAVER